MSASGPLPPLGPHQPSHQWCEVVDEVRVAAPWLLRAWVTRTSRKAHEETMAKMAQLLGRA